jgi:hypothetical protein
MLPSGGHMNATTIGDTVASAIKAVRSAVTLTTTTVSSHTVTVISGLESPSAIAAFGTYAFWAGIVQAVRVNLELASDLFAFNGNFALEVQRDLTDTLGSDNQNITDDFREDERNPWLGECVGHLLLNCYREEPTHGVPGRLVALSPIHDDVKDHGLDLVGLHVEPGDLLSLSAGEAKASELYAKKHAAGAATLFHEIDQGIRDMHLRQRVQLLREGLLPAHSALVTPAFWRHRRSYVAVISFAQGSQFSPTHPRKTFQKLAVSTDRIRLWSIPLSDYHGFFDAVSDAARTVASDLVKAL